MVDVSLDSQASPDVTVRLLRLFAGTALLAAHLLTVQVDVCLNETNLYCLKNKWPFFSRRLVFSRGGVGGGGVDH